jgi:hypothetical protein
MANRPKAAPRLHDQHSAALFEWSLQVEASLGVCIEVALDVLEGCGG